jgi:hypothetical protein
MKLTDILFADCMGTCHVYALITFKPLHCLFSVNKWLLGTDIVFMYKNYTTESLRGTEIFGFCGLFNYALFNGLWKDSEI